MLFHARFVMAHFITTAKKLRFSKPFIYTFWICLQRFLLINCVVGLPITEWYSLIRYWKFFNKKITFCSLNAFMSQQPMIYRFVHVIHGNLVVHLQCFLFMKINLEIICSASGDKMNDKINTSIFIKIDLIVWMSAASHTYKLIRISAVYKKSVKNKFNFQHVKNTKFKWSEAEGKACQQYIYEISSSARLC